jgi:hypothetical protein
VPPLLLVAALVEEVARVEAPPWDGVEAPPVAASTPRTVNAPVALPKDGGR